MGGVGQSLARVAWVAWVHKSLAWVSWMAWVEILVWVASVHNILAWVAWVEWVKKNEVLQINGIGLSVLLFNHTLQKTLYLL